MIFWIIKKRKKHFLQLDYDDDMAIDLRVLKSFVRLQGKLVIYEELVSFGVETTIVFVHN